MYTEKEAADVKRVDTIIFLRRQRQHFLSQGQTVAADVVREEIIKMYHDTGYIPQVMTPEEIAFVAANTRSFTPRVSTYSEITNEYFF